MARRPHFQPGASVTGRPGLVDPVQVDPAGLTGPTAAQALGQQWRRTSRGWYVPATTPTTVEQRIREAAVVVPAYGGVTGWAALRWLGARWFDGYGTDGATELPVMIAAVAAAVRPQPGIRVCAERLAPTSLMRRDGLPLTDAVRSAVFEMRYAAGVRLAVAIADMAMYADLFSISELTDYVMAHWGWTGIPHTRDALPLCNENAWSPQEVRLRLVWVLDCGFPPPLCNVPVFDRSGRHIGTPDILDPVAGVAGEYDGPLHLEGFRRAHDVRREEAFRAVGLECFTVLAPDWRSPGIVSGRMAAARERAKFAAPSRREWTLQKPSWWISTETVEQRRALSEAQRVRLLRHRAS